MCGVAGVGCVGASWTPGRSWMLDVGGLIGAAAWLHDAWQRGLRRSQSCRRPSSNASSGHRAPLGARAPATAHVPHTHTTHVFLSFGRVAAPDASRHIVTARPPAPRTPGRAPPRAFFS
eukprot:3027900-Prymnesium_polylepis.1